MKISQLVPFGCLIEMADANELMEKRSEIFDLAHENSFVVVRGMSVVLGNEEFIDFSRDNGRNEIIEFNGQAIIDIKYVPENPNYLFSAEKVPYHFDGAFHKMPRYLVWNCVSTDEQPGGATLFVNGEKIIEALCSQEHKECDAIRITYSTEKLAHYGGEVTIPLKEKHPHKDRFVLRYAEPVQTQKNPLTLHVHNTENQDVFIRMMEEMLYSNELMLVHEWQFGDVVIADNYSLLHGRRHLSGNVRRHIRRIHVS